MERNKQMEILLIEDNTNDIRLVKEALEKSENPSNLNIATDGNSAIEYLVSSGSNIKLPRPDLIILDLKLPGKNGNEVLEFIKNNDHFLSIPVVILTDSKSTQDINETYNLHANCFVIKPLDPDMFTRYIVAIDNFWKNVVKVPKT
jgi:chemotaxis family two-component system response regulator Rcp1